MIVPDLTSYVGLIMNLFGQFEQATVGPAKRGHPYEFSEPGMIAFFMVMQARRKFQFLSQVKWLQQHPLYLLHFGFERVPHRTTLARRYKQLYPTLQAFVEWVGQYGALLDPALGGGDWFTDKSLFKAWGPVWHQSDRLVGRIPDKLRHLDTDATWSKSAYQGWVYGYGVHLLCQHNAFPLRVQVETAAVAEAGVLEQWEADLLSDPRPSTVTADNGYFQATRTRRWASAGVLLLTPAKGWKTVRFATAYHGFRQLPHNQQLLARRRTTIEPCFDLLAKVLGTDKQHKQLPVQGVPTVRTCLALATFSVQLAMLGNSIWGLPLRAVSYLTNALS